jgi:hypothetical protein
LTSLRSAGEPGKIAALFVTDIVGVPFFRYIRGGLLDSHGNFTLQGALPNDPNLPGLIFSLATFSFDSANSLVNTNEVTILLL